MLAGLQFWRGPSRELYAVAQKRLKDGGDSEPARINLTDSDPEEEDFERPAKKKMRKDPGEKQLDTIMKDVSTIKESIADMSCRKGI